jgi:hypothetical protein
MIHMQVAPPHPISFGHHPKNRMGTPAKIPGLPRESFQQTPKLRYIHVKLYRSRPANLLIHLWHRRNPVRPSKREIQCAPFHPCSPESSWFRSQSLLADHTPKRITQVTDHLVRRHLSPSPMAVDPHRSQPIRNLFPALGLAQGLHSPPHYRLFSTSPLCPAILLACPTKPACAYNSRSTEHFPGH